MNLNKEISAYLKLKRIESNYTQKELSMLFDYKSPQFISNYERGICLPPNKSLKKMIKKLNMDKNTVIDMLLRRYERKLRKEL